jgi:hypothetical protein
VPGGTSCCDLEHKLRCLCEFDYTPGQFFIYVKIRVNRGEAWFINKAAVNSRVMFVTAVSTPTLFLWT